MATPAPKPFGHCEVIEYATEQPTVAACAERLTPRPATRAAAVAEAASRARTEARIPESFRCTRELAGPRGRSRIDGNHYFRPRRAGPQGLLTGTPLVTASRIMPMTTIEICP